MKKFKMVSAIISLIIGFAFYMAAKVTISTNSRYTFTKPYTKFEIETLTYKWIGIFLLVFGIIDIVLLVIAKRREATFEDPNNLGKRPTNTVKCPNCGLTISATTRVCPKCNKILKGD